MPAYPPTRKVSPENYYFLEDIEPLGPAIASFAGAPIFDSVRDESGRIYTYAGLAPRLRDSRIDFAALRKGEFVVKPGLVYAVKPAVTNEARSARLRLRG